jgi:hypothetical protein
MNRVESSEGDFLSASLPDDLKSFENGLLIVGNKDF